MTNATAPYTPRPRDPEEPGGPGREELEGRSAGVAVCAVMGLVWAASALGGLRSLVAVPLLLAGVATMAVLLAGSRRLRQAAGKQAASPSGPADLGPADLGPIDLRKVRRRFTLVVVGELAAIAVAINVLTRSGHPLWIPAVICAVVGLHFVPLARLFEVEVYDATAAAMCVVATATMILGAIGAPESVWRLLPGFGAAAALWATGARLLVTTPRKRSRGTRRVRR